MVTGPVQNVAITTSHGEINATAVKHPKVPVEVEAVIVVVVVTEEVATAVEEETIEAAVEIVVTTVVVVTVETTEMEIAEITIEVEMTTDHRVENIEVAMIEEHPVVILENPVAGAQKARAGLVDAEITRGAFM